jgi:diguanylate cyclase (GGDEF)-like protein/PAS domain S-box-containing protein
VDLQEFMDFSPFDRLQTPIWVYDIQHSQMVWANRAALRIWDAPTLKELISRDFSDISASTQARLLSYLEAFHQGQTVQDHWTFYPQGKPVSIQCFCSGVRLDEGRLAMLVEGHQLQSPIEQDMLRSVEAFRHSPGLVSLFTQEGNLLMQNPAAAACYGNTPSFSQRFLDPSLARQAQAALEREQVWQQECQVCTRTGTPWHRLDLRCTRDPVTGQPAMVLSETDISDRKRSEIHRNQLEDERQRMEQALAESDIRYQTVVQVLAEGVVIHQADGAIVACNTSAQDILGLSADQLMGKTSLDPLWHTIHEDGTPFPGQEHPAMVTLRTGKPQRNIIMGVYRPDHSLRWISVNTQTIYPSGAEQLGSIVVSFTDITERKINEDLIRTSETTKQAMLEAIPDLLLLMNRDGLCLTLISGGEIQLWQPVKPGERQPLHEILPASAVQQRLHYIAQALDTGERQIYRQDLEINGRQHYEEVRIVPISSEEVLVMVRDFTDQYLATQALQESEARWQFALEGSGDGVWDWDALTNQVFFSNQWKAMLGYEPHEIGNTLDEWDSRVHPDDKARCYKDLDRHFRGETPVYQNEHRVRCKDGRYKWILDRGKVIEWDGQGQPKRVIGTHTDMTERHRMEQKLRQQAEMLQAIFDHIPIMIALIDPQGKIQFINKALENSLGWPLKDWQTKDILAECYPDPKVRQQVVDHIKRPNDQWLDFRTRNILGQTINTSWYNLRLSDGRTIGIGQDITERKQWEEQLQHLATHDKLTSLPNRYQFDEYLAQEWKRLSREQQPISLILCDIDEFKAYNDTLGHIAGDHCLVQVAHTIANVLKRPTDLATRYGGEEFALVLPNTHLDGAVNLANQIHQAVADMAIPHPNSSVNTYVTLSFGVACVYPSHQRVPQQLTAMADTALYEAKRRGRNRYCIAE